MKPQARPFTVEIKRTKRPAHSSPALSAAFLRPSDRSLREHPTRDTPPDGTFRGAASKLALSEADRVFGQSVTPVPVAAPVLNGIDLPQNADPQPLLVPMSRRLLRPMMPRGTVARSLARDAFSPTFSRPPGRKSEPRRLRLLVVGGCREAPDHLPGPRQHSLRRDSPTSPSGPAASGRPVPSRARERRSLRVPRWPPSWRRWSPALIKLRYQPSRAALAEGTLVGGSVERSSERGTPFRSGRVSVGNAAFRLCADRLG